MAVRYNPNNNGFEGFSGFDGYKSINGSVGRDGVAGPDYPRSRWLEQSITLRQALAEEHIKSNGYGQVKYIVLALRSRGFSDREIRSESIRLHNARTISSQRLVEIRECLVIEGELELCEQESTGISGVMFGINSQCTSMGAMLNQSATETILSHLPSASKQFTIEGLDAWDDNSVIRVANEYVAKQNLIADVMFGKLSNLKIICLVAIGFFLITSFIGVVNMQWLVITLSIPLGIGSVMGFRFVLKKMNNIVRLEKVNLNNY